MTPASPFRCEICGGQLNPNDPNVRQAVRGWQRMAGVRASGKHGGSDIENRRPLQEWAHGPCVTLEKSGLLGQESLV
jgi:hypothetical protein